MQKLFEFVAHIGKWRVLVQSRDIQNGSVTREKMADGAVSERVLQEGAVSMEKLDEELRTLVLSGGGSAVPLSGDWGDSEYIGMTQKKLSEAHADLQEQISTAQTGLQEQIDALVAGKAEVGLVVSADVIAVGRETTVAVTASTDTEASSIVMKLGNTAIATGSGLSLTEDVALTPLNDRDYVFSAEVTIAGIVRAARKVVTAMSPIRYGSGANYSSVILGGEEALRLTPAGTYTVTVESNGDYVFFMVPQMMTINGAKMGGLDFPLDAAASAGEGFKYYKSSNSYDAGTLTIEIE